MSTRSLSPELPVGTTLKQSPALFQLFEKIGELSTLPVIAQRVLQIANDPESDFDDLRRVVQADPSLAVQILKRVNSAHYGLRNKVTDLRTAINMLGFREIRNLTLDVFVSKMFQSNGAVGPYTRENLWRHCQAVASTSRMIAKVCGRANAEEAYLAGLLHDIGYILIDQHLGRFFCEIIERLEPDVPTPQIERSVLPFDHTQLGAFVARNWKLPTGIEVVLRYHHHPDAYIGEFQDLLDTVALANYLCSRAGRSALGVHNLAPLPDPVFARMAIDRSGLAVIWAELQEILAEDLFRLAG